MIFYTLHELFNLLEINEKEHGKRNSKLLLFGTFIWILVFIYVINYFGPKKLWKEPTITGLWVMLMVDLFVMAYTYKSYFGRSILWEMDENDELFDYDESKHKYKKKKKKSSVSVVDKI